MSGPVRTLAEKWSALRSGDPYTAVEEFADTAASDLWPYTVIVDQIESGWSDDFRGAVALNLASRYKPVEHALAAFVTLNGQWPSTNATTALNLLALAHRTAPSSQDPLDRFVSQAALRCLRQGLGDPSPLVAEEAANILGGFGAHHFSAATSHDISQIRALADTVLARINDEDLSQLLRTRSESVFADAKAAAALGEVEARLMLKELEPQWTRMGSADAPLAALLKTHVTALTWAVARTTPRAVQVVHIEYPKSDSGKALSAWSVIGPWIAVVRDLLDADQDEHQTLVFEPINATVGSLVITLQINADADTHDAIARRLRAAKSAPLTSAAAEALGDVLRSHGLRIRVAHIEADLSSASLTVDPDSIGVASAPLHSRKLTTSEVPQANEWDRILAVVDGVAERGNVAPESIGVTTSRQVQYYKAAARTLGLLAATDELTRAGWLLHVATGDERYDRAREAFEASPCGQAWLEWSKVTKLSDIRPNSAQDFLTDRSELTGDTISRRAGTLEVWLKKLSTPKLGD